MTDYEGWRPEICLSEADASRLAVDGKRQYFSAADIREIVQYAERHIGRARDRDAGLRGAAARSYPEYFTRTRVFNPANLKTYDFNESHRSRCFSRAVLDFAGDEVGDETWKGMADVDRFKAEQGLKTTKDIQAYFGRKVVGIIESLGKRPMAWDEQVEAQAPKSVVIQWWRRDRPDVLAGAARNGYELVISPADQLYFDYHQGPGEPGAAVEQLMARRVQFTERCGGVRFSPHAWNTADEVDRALEALP